MINGNRLVEITDDESFTIWRALLDEADHARTEEGDGARAAELVDLAKRFYIHG